MDLALTATDDLVAAAARARANARAPYSTYSVGAAVRDRSGRVQERGTLTVAAHVGHLAAT